MVGPLPGRVCGPTVRDMATAPAPSARRRLLAGVVVLAVMLALGWALGEPVTRSLLHAVPVVVVVQVALALPPHRFRG